jgi:hypothetical protein
MKGAPCSLCGDLHCEKVRCGSHSSFSPFHLQFEFSLVLTGALRETPIWQPHHGDFCRGRQYAFKSHKPHKSPIVRNLSSSQASPEAGDYRSGRSTTVLSFGFGRKSRSLPDQFRWLYPYW